MFWEILQLAVEFEGFMVEFVPWVVELLDKVEDALPDVFEAFVVKFAPWVVELLLEALVVELAAFVGEWLVPGNVLVAEGLVADVVELELSVDKGLEPKKHFKDS